MSVWLGIDCGGTNTKILLATERDGQLVELTKTRFATPGGSEPLAEVARGVSAHLAGVSPAAFAVAIPGVIDAATGTVLTSTNLPWMSGSKPAERLSAALGIPGVVIHDGAAMANAEVVMGAARGHDDAFIVGLGTGVAGAHLLRHKVRRGFHNAAGEIGHVYQGGRERCSCGQTGCLESIVGGSQLGRRWSEICGGASGAKTAKDLVEAAKAGNTDAADILDEATTALARSFLGLVALLDPGIIVVGGGLATAREQVVTPTIEKTKAMATFHQLPPIVPAALGMWGASWGAVLAAGGEVASGSLEE